MGCAREERQPLPPEKALFDAIEQGDIAAVKRMLAEAPGLLEETDEYGHTPLMQAVDSPERCPELVQTLLEAEADVNARTEEGYTALHMIADAPRDSAEMPSRLARLLVDAGADLEARQHWGWTPLMRAVVEGSADELGALVDAGAELNNQFPCHTLPEFLRGRTTLTAAIDRPEKTRILVDAGVDVSARDAHGQTALEYARQCLADARKSHLDPKTSFRELMAKLIDESLKDMARNGLASDDGIEKLRKRMLSSIPEYDYCKAVEDSIRIVEEAMGKTR